MKKKYIIQIAHIQVMNVWMLKLMMWDFDFCFCFNLIFWNETKMGREKKVDTPHEGTKFNQDIVAELI